MVLDPCLELIQVLLLELALGMEEGVAGSDVDEDVVRLR